MHICNCEHPRLIIDPHSGEKIRVRCGKCPQCMNSRAKNWINRLLEESQHNKYVFMVNLTYDNDHLPRLKRGEKGLVWANRNLDLLIPYEDIDNLFSKLSNKQKEKEYNYLNSRLDHRLGLPCICIDDIQKFNKRLNKHIHDKFTNQYGNFRFFQCGEYGPATFRIHYHGLYFTNSKKVAENFPEIISACWENGDSSAAHVYSKGGISYVAQYVNMLTHLPKIYEISKLRQRHTFSKCPPIGSSKLLASEIREIYDRKPIKRTVWDAASSRYNDLPVNTTFKNRFFPKCEGYSRITDKQRASLYRIAELFPSDDFNGFTEEIYRFYSHVTRSCFKVSEHSQGILNIVSKRNSCFNISRDYEGLVNFLYELKMHTKEPEKVEAKLYRSYLVSKRFLYIRDTLNCSSDYLVKQIDEFYKKIDYERLKDFYQFQSIYSKSHSTVDLINMYPEFSDYLDKLKKCDIDSVPDYLRLALFSFGIDWYSEFLPSLDSTYDAQLVKSMHNKIYKDTHKAHDVHNYRYSKRLQSLDPELQKIVISYGS